MCWAKFGLESRAQFGCIGLTLLRKQCISDVLFWNSQKFNTKTQVLGAAPLA